jgi:hypothetical protein
VLIIITFVEYVLDIFRRDKVGIRWSDCVLRPLDLEARIEYPATSLITICSLGLVCVRHEKRLSWAEHSIKPLVYKFQLIEYTSGIFNEWRLKYNIIPDSSTEKLRYANQNDKGRFLPAETM